MSRLTTKKGSTKKQKQRNKKVEVQQKIRGKRMFFYLKL